MSVMIITDQTIEQKIKEEKVILIDFWAPWCVPCRTIAPILDDLAIHYGDRVTISKVNIDGNPYSAIKYHIQGIPYLKLFVNGREVENIVGVQPFEKLSKIIDSHL